MRSPSAGIGLALLALSLPLTQAHAETKTWASPVSGNWNDPIRWTPPGAPIAGDVVVVPVGGGPYTINLDSNIGPLASLDVAHPSATFALNGFSLHATSGAWFSGPVLASGASWIGGPLHTRASGTLAVPPGGVLALGCADWFNDGSVTIGAAGATAESYVRPTTALRLEGTGTLRLMDPGRAILDSPAGWNVVQSEGHSITGTGMVVAPLDNHGQILADVGGSTLLLGNLRLNTGSLRAANGGLLRISGSTVQGSGGSVLAESGDIEFVSSVVVGGNFEGTGSSAVRWVGGNTLANASLAGSTRVPPGSALSMAGDWTNEGIVELGETNVADDAFVRPSTHATLSGTGELRLRDEGHSILDSPGGWTLTQAAGHRVRGQGVITAPFTNHGSVLADDPGRTLALSGTWTNDGVLAATGGILSLNAVSLTNAGGQLRNDGGELRVASSLVVSGTVAAAAGQRVDWAGGVAIADVELEGDQRIAPGAAMTMIGASVTHHGRLEIGAEGMPEYAYLRPGSHVTLGGSGRVVLPDATRSIFDSPGGWGLTQLAGHTISGTGTFAAPLVNHGTLEADLPGRTLLVIGNVDNRSLVRARAGGTLRLQGMTLSQAGGRLVAEGGNLECAAASVTGGRIERTGTSKLRLIGSAGWGDLTHTGETVVTEGTAANLGGTIRNDGRLSIGENNTSSWSWLRPASHLALVGTGEVRLEHPSLAAFDSPGGWTVTQADSHSIRGTGWLLAPIVNHGTIRADREGQVLHVAGPNQHTGTLEAAYGGSLHFDALPANWSQGTLAGGTWRAYSGSAIRFPNAPIHTVAAAVVLDGPRSRIEVDDAGTSALANLARIAPGGLFAVRNGREFLSLNAFINEGTLMVGDASVLRVESPGVLDAGARSYSQSSTGTLTLEIAGREPGRCGRVDVFGPVTLAGTLRVGLLGGFVPTPGDSFVVMTFDERDGAFTTWDGFDVAPGVWLSPVWEARRLILVARDRPNVDAPTTDVPRALAFSVAGTATAPIVELALAQPAHVRVEVFDVTGRRLQRLVDEDLTAGRWRWPVALPAGLAFARARIESGSRTEVRATKLVTWH